MLLELNIKPIANNCIKPIANKYIKPIASHTYTSCQF